MFRPESRARPWHGGCLDLLLVWWSADGLPSRERSLAGPRPEGSEPRAGRQSGDRKANFSAGETLKATGSASARSKGLDRQRQERTARVNRAHGKKGSTWRRENPRRGSGQRNARPEATIDLQMKTSKSATSDLCWFRPASRREITAWGELPATSRGGLQNGNKPLNGQAPEKGNEPWQAVLVVPTHRVAAKVKEL